MWYVKILTFGSNCPYKCPLILDERYYFPWSNYHFQFLIKFRRKFTRFHLYPKSLCSMKCPYCMYNVKEISLPLPQVHHLIPFLPSCAVQVKKSNSECSISSGCQSYSNELISCKLPVRKTSPLCLCSSCTFSLE